MNPAPDPCESVWNRSHLNIALRFYLDISTNSDLSLVLQASFDKSLPKL